MIRLLRVVPGADFTQGKLVKHERYWTKADSKLVLRRQIEIGPHRTVNEAAAKAIGLTGRLVIDEIETPPGKPIIDEIEAAPAWIDKVRRRGPQYSTTGSPYDPVNHFEGQRWGSAAHPLRFDIVIRQSWRTRLLPALRGWAAEPAGEHPYGLRPYEAKWRQAIASAVVTDRLGLSNDRHASQRLRDLKIHILERRRESGAAFGDRPWDPKSAECARGIRYEEHEGIELYRRSDQLRWYMTPPVDDEAAAFDSQAAKYDDAMQLKPGPDSGLGGWAGRGRDSSAASLHGFEFQEVDNTIARRRARYGRPLRLRRKPGRKPLGERAMTTAERVAKHRQKYNQR